VEDTKLDFAPSFDEGDGRYWMSLRRDKTAGDRLADISAALSFRVKLNRDLRSLVSPSGKNIPFSSSSSS
jgi:hypothetical protein